MSLFSPACYARVYIKISAGMFPFYLSINTMQMLMLECITVHKMIYSILSPLEQYVEEYLCQDQQMNTFIQAR